MFRFAPLLTVLVVFWLGGIARATDLCDRSLGAELRCTRCAAIPCWCPDDYCPKPLPCVPCLKRSCLPDDYCPKPLPCVPCRAASTCVDDYCPKPLPVLCWPLSRQFLRCPPPEQRVARP
ncbi:MAG: hypothetical protein ACYC35_15960 [Pirellulales bacterium]